MSSVERPEADLAEQTRDDDEPVVPDGPTDLEAPEADALDQQRDAGLPDEDEAR